MIVQWEFSRIHFNGGTILYHIFGHILAVYPLLSPYTGLKNRPKIYGIGTSNQSFPVAWPLIVCGCRSLQEFEQLDPKTKYMLLQRAQEADERCPTVNPVQPGNFNSLIFGIQVEIYVYIYPDQGK
jgi:hypothetical protein